ncbi:MAG: GntR family transcriptional regulator [Oscillibacter sp.]
MENDALDHNLRGRVRQQLLELIGRMDFEYSTRLLSENQLAAKFQVSRSTIRAVLAALESEGKIIRRHGSGTYVNPPALGVETTLYPRVNMYDLILKNGYRPTMDVLFQQDLPAEDRGHKLNLFPFDRVTEVHSIYRGDGKPCMYCIDTVDARRFSGVDWKEHEKMPGSIYDYIRMAAHVDITWDIINIRAADSDQLPVLRECFSVPEGTVKSVVLLEITNFDSANQPALLGNIYIDTDLIRLNIVRDLTKL